MVTPSDDMYVEAPPHRWRSEVKSYRCLVGDLGASTPSFRWRSVQAGRPSLVAGHASRTSDTIKFATQRSRLAKKLAASRKPEGFGVICTSGPQLSSGFMYLAAYAAWKRLAVPGSTARAIDVSEKLEIALTDKEYEPKVWFDSWSLMGWRRPASVLAKLCA